MKLRFEYKTALVEVQSDARQKFSGAANKEQQTEQATAQTSYFMRFFSHGMLQGTRDVAAERKEFVRRRLKEKSAGDLLQEIWECEKELKIYRDLQKVFANDYVDFVRWTEQLAHRQTVLGRVTYYLGKVVALSYLVRLFFSTKNIVYPSEYRSDRISSNVHRVLRFLQLYQDEDELFWQIIIQYVQIFFIGILIASNIRSFLSSLLKTVKTLLRDQLIQISYNSTILVFSYIMGTYYMATLLQLSMNLPENNRNREAFGILLDTFSPDFIFYTFDCAFLVSSILCLGLLYSNWYIKQYS